MKLKYKLPLVTMLVLIITFVFLWIVTRRTALSYVMDYLLKISIEQEDLYQLAMNILIKY